MKGTHKMEPVLDPSLRLHILARHKQKLTVASAFVRPPPPFGSQVRMYFSCVNLMYIDVLLACI